MKNKWINKSVWKPLKRLHENMCRFAFKWEPAKSFHFLSCLVSKTDSSDSKVKPQMFLFVVFPPCLHPLTLLSLFFFFFYHILVQIHRWKHSKRLNKTLACVLNVNGVVPIDSTLTTVTIYNFPLTILKENTPQHTLPLTYQRKLRSLKVCASILKYWFLWYQIFMFYNQFLY